MIVVVEVLTFAPIWVLHSIEQRLSAAPLMTISGVVSIVAIIVHQLLRQLEHHLVLLFQNLINIHWGLRSTHHHGRTGHVLQAVLYIGSTSAAPRVARCASPRPRGWCATVGIDALTASLSANSVERRIACAIHGFVHVANNAPVSATAIVVPVSHRPRPSRAKMS
jgi:hypothetical protein